MTNTEREPPVKALVLDAHPLITQHISTLSTYASSFYVTPSVFKEIKDENARRNLELWGDKLKIRHPKPEFLKKVIDFAKLTGDFNVLSANDLHIIALTYEIESELNGGHEHLRSFPGEKKDSEKGLESQNFDNAPGKKQREDDGWSTVPSKSGSKTSKSVSKSGGNKNSEIKESTIEKPHNKDSEVKNEPEVKKKRRRGGKKQREKREAAQANSKPVNEAQLKVSEEESVDNKEVSQSAESKEGSTESKENEVENGKEEESDIAQNLQNLKISALAQSINDILKEVPQLESTDQVNGEEKDDEEEDDDDGEWITSENLSDTIRKDTGEKLEETQLRSKVALSSQDFAVQNVALQIGLKLMNVSTGMQIKRIRSYMLRCHACFKLQPITESTSKHFCAYCGGATLLRCTVVVDAKTGEMKPLLKKNFEWHNKGNRYSLPSPLSKNTQKKLGKGGFQHNKNSKNYDAYNSVPILRADQKEYSKAIKNEQWVQKQNDKFLENWIGGGSADNFYSPFANGDSSNRYHSNVKVSAGRYANAPRGRH